MMKATWSGEAWEVRGRYLNACNDWEVAWNAALDRIDEEKSSPTMIDPYQEAWNASDNKRIKEGVPSKEWNYELCRRYTSLELENQKKLKEWGRKFMPDEQSELEKRQMGRIKKPKTD